jgi:TolB-like protein/Tfp pilus assembly protein PilF
MNWRFEEFEVDDARFELRRNGAVLHLEPKVLLLLVHLVRNRDRTVSKDELFDAVWQGAAVVDSALTRAVSVLRTALGDTGRAQNIIVTVPGRGYRFAARAREFGREGTEATLGRPALAVLPFANLNSAPDQEYFADGITEALITELSYWRRFPVIARNAAFAYKAERPAVGQIGRALGCRYVLEGSVFRSRERVRIAAHLSNAETDCEMWAEHYDRGFGEMFSIQDEIARKIVTSIEPELSHAEIDRALRKSQENLDSWDFSLRAAWHIHAGTRAELAQASHLLDKAIELDPLSPYAHSLRALCLFEEAIPGWTRDPPRVFSAALKAAERAVALDPRDWLAHTLMGITSLWVERDHERAIELEERAISFNPSGARSYHFLGCVLAYAGRPAEGIEKLKTVLRLDPYFRPTALILSDLALGHLLARNSNEAVSLARRAVREAPQNPRPLQRLISALAHAGREEEAAVALGQLLQIQPDFSLGYVDTTYPFKNPGDRQFFVDGLRRAGFRE